MWTQSDSVGKIAFAIAKAQKEMAPLVRNSENPFFHSKYADLKACYAACGNELAEAGVAVVQGAGCDENGNAVIHCTFIHAESGEWLQSTLTMKPVKSDPQGIGSAITYGRRYLLCAMAGLAPEDDDGEAATRPAKKTRKTKAKPAPTPKQDAALAHAQEAFGGTPAGEQAAQSSNSAQPDPAGTATLPKEDQAQSDMLDHLKESCDEYVGVYKKLKDTKLLKKPSEILQSVSRYADTFNDLKLTEMLDVLKLIRVECKNAKEMYEEENPPSNIPGEGESLL